MNIDRDRKKSIDAYSIWTGSASDANRDVFDLSLVFCVESVYCYFQIVARLGEMRV